MTSDSGGNSGDLRPSAADDDETGFGGFLAIAGIFFASMALLLTVYSLSAGALSIMTVAMAYLVWSSAARQAPGEFWLPVVAIAYFALNARMVYAMSGSDGWGLAACIGLAASAPLIVLALVLLALPRGQATRTCRLSLSAWMIGISLLNLAFFFEPIIF
jgi:hypothetical protein